jgi:multidrug efflux system membrane fusion protein
MIAYTLLTLALFGQLLEAPAASESPGNYSLIDIESGIVAKNDIRMPAEVEGLITSLPVHDGMLVAKGHLLATIDDRQAKAAVEVAEKGFAAADERAKDDIEEEYAAAAADVARTDYKMAMEANSRIPGTFAPIEVDKKRLDLRRATLQIKKAIHDQLLARLEADGKQAELNAANVAIDRRQVYAPWDGQVETLYLHESEWANPGDPILRLIQFDELYVDTTIPSDAFDPSELQGRPVTVVVDLPHERTATVQGHVLHASQSAIGSSSGFGAYKVRAIVHNQRVGNFWLVRPGLPARMTIHIDQPPVASGDPVEQSAGVE